MQKAIQNQPEQIIQNRLSAIQRRMQVDGLFQNLARFGFWGLLIAGTLLIANRFFPVPIPIALVVSLPLVIAIAIVVGLSLLRKTDRLAVAHLVDQRLDLKERLGTAVEAIRQGIADDFTMLQIRDAARVAQGLVPAAALSYMVPPMLKWLPIPILMVGVSFFIPLMYELPPPPTAAEHAAIDEAAARLEQEVDGIDDTALVKRVEETAKALRNKRTTVQTAQKQLSKLREEVQVQKGQLAENEINQVVEAISELGDASKLLSGADAGEIASELQKLADQLDGLTAEQRAELDALLRRLAEQLAGNAAAKNLTDRLNEIETQGVSPEMLAKIARSLLELDRQAKDIAQMEGILEEIKASRKNIGLAGIEMARKTGGMASSDGAGEESETGEAQGTQVGDATSDGPEVQPAEELQLTGVTSDSQEFSSVAMQETLSDEDEPIYMQHHAAYLSAKQAYAEAMGRGRIPVRYQQQVKDYLEAIANTNQ